MRKIKRILLASPPAPGLKDKTSYPPLGILYLASNISANIEIHILDMVTGKEQIGNDFDLYGISIHSAATYIEGKKVIDRIRLTTETSFIVVGGAFPTSMPEYVLNNTGGDVVVRGEGEKAFNEIVSGRKLEMINGVTYKANGKIYSTPSQSLIENLDELKFPARHLLPRERIVHEGRVHHGDEPATTIFASRGCPWNCNYCQKDIWTRKWRSRSPQNIRQEIKLLKREYGISWFRFPDDNVTVNKDWFLEFCQMLQEEKVKWTILSRSDTIDIEMLEKAKLGGCQEIFFGFESGSSKMLKAMGRRNTVEQNRRAIELCRQVGVKSCAYFMFGFPGENDKTVKETMNFLKKVRPDKAKLHTFIPIPGTDVWNNPQKYNVRVKTNFEEHWHYDNPETGELYPLALEYDYLNCGNEKMIMLRQTLIDFFRKEGYIGGWTESSATTDGKNSC